MKAAAFMERSSVNIRDLIDQQIEKRLAAVVAEAVPQEGQRLNIGGRGHTGRTHAHINVTIPAEINEALERLGGIKSQHIASALRLYLNIAKTNKGGRGKKGKTHKALGVSIPNGVYAQLENLEGTKSNNVAKALQLYFKQKV